MSIERKNVLMQQKVVTYVRNGGHAKYFDDENRIRSVISENELTIAVSTVYSK